MKTYFPLFCLLTLIFNGCLKTIADRDVVSGEMTSAEPAGTEPAGAEPAAGLPRAAALRPRLRKDRAVGGT